MTPTAQSPGHAHFAAIPAYVTGGRVSGGVSNNTYTRRKNKYKTRANKIRKSKKLKKPRKPKKHYKKPKKSRKYRKGKKGKQSRKN